MLTIILTALVFVAFCAALNIESNSRRRGSTHEVLETVFGAGTVLVGIFLLIILVAAPLIYFDSRSKIASMRGMQDNITTYEQTVSQSEAIVLAGRSQVTAVTDTAYLAQAQSVSSRLQEYRDNIVQYNQTRRSLENMNHIPIIRSWTSKLPSDIPPIEMKGK